MYFERIDINERIDPIKRNKSKESMICHYWFFNYGFEFQDAVCNGYDNVQCLYKQYCCYHC